MPLVLDPGDGDAIELDQLVEMLDATPFDVRDESSFAAVGPLLARLGRNGRFLTDLAIAELKTRFNRQEAFSTYGAQVLMLRPANGRYVLRANFWPARDDAVVRASGTAPFFYDLPHDHNFPFLTYGYLGPGYWSDYYEFGGAADALPGDAARLRFVERSRLEPGKLMLYRAHRDVHVQLPPDAFSVSLNILGYDRAQPWRSQYRFDIASDTVAAALTTTPSEALATLAAQFGGGNGLDLVHSLLRQHPSARMRRTALDALAAKEDGAAGRVRVYEAAVDLPEVGRHARRQLDRIQTDVDTAVLVPRQRIVGAWQRSWSLVSTDPGSARC